MLTKTNVLLLKKHSLKQPLHCTEAFHKRVRLNDAGQDGNGNQFEKVGTAFSSSSFVQLGLISASESVVELYLARQKAEIGFQIESSIFKSRIYYKKKTEGTLSIFYNPN